MRRNKATTTKSDKLQPGLRQYLRGNFAEGHSVPCWYRTTLPPYDVACLAPSRIVWRTVNGVGNTVAIAIPFVPVPAFQLPSVIPLGPSRLSQAEACPFTLPVPGLPYVTFTLRVPISRRPHIATTWRRDRFIANRRRRNVEIDSDFGARRRGYGNTPKRCCTQSNKQ